MRKTLPLILAATMLFSACSTTTPPQSSSQAPPPISEATGLTLQIGDEPQTLDPAFAYQTDEQTYLTHIYTGLVVLDSSLQPQPGVAKSWEKSISDAGLISYTFVLDETAVWSDGTPVTAEDFIYSWQRTLDPATASPLAYKLYPIQGALEYNTPVAEPEATATADTTPVVKTPLDGISIGENGELIITLDGDYEDFLQRLATPVYAPLKQSVIEANPTTWYYDAENFVGNGRYLLEEWTRDEKIVLTKNSSYTGSLPPTNDTLNFMLSSDSTAILDDFTSGRLQLAKDIPLYEMEQIEDGTYGVTESSDTAPSYPVEHISAGGTLALACNVNSETLADPQLRQILSATIDRTALSQTMRDGSMPATGLVPYGVQMAGQEHRSLAGSFPTTTYSIQEAQTALQALEYTSNTITLLISDNATHKAIADTVTQTWGELGFDVVTEELPWVDYIEKRTLGEYDITPISVFVDGFTPHNFLDTWTSTSSLNYTGYADPYYDNFIRIAHGFEPVDIAEDTETAVAETTTETPQSTDGTASSEAVVEEVQPDPALIKAQALADAESMLVDEHAVIMPLTFYMDRYVNNNYPTDILAFPDGYLYLGG